MRVTRKLLIIALVLVSIRLIPVRAQSARLTFEAATIKPSKSGDNAIDNRFGPELATWTNVTLRDLLKDTHWMKDYQILSAPGWVNTDRWDINARANGATTFQQKMEMLEVMIEERFHLKFHMETRELPVYILTAVKGGPRFQPPETDDQPAGVKILSGFNSAIIGHKMDVSLLPDYLSAQLNMPVIDKAGLKGIQDLALEWTPVPNEGNFAVRNDAGAQPPTTDASGPTIFTALQEQLGLKLESSKGPVQVLVIDSVERPTEN